jgi:hypothetical protein
VSDNAIVALIPRGASGEVHSTLCYFPVGVTSFMREIVPRMAWLWQPVVASVSEHGQLGPDEERTTVAFLQSPMLFSMYSVLSGFTSSQYSYVPHISAQPGYVLPPVSSLVQLDRIALWNDDDRIAWRLGSGEPCAA